MKYVSSEVYREEEEELFFFFFVSFPLIDATGRKQLDFNGDFVLGNASIESGAARVLCFRDD